MMPQVSCPTCNFGAIRTARKHAFRDEGRQREPRGSERAGAMLGDDRVFLRPPREGYNEQDLLLSVGDGSFVV